MTPTTDRRDWTPPLVFGAVAGVVLLVLCLAGGVTAFVLLRNGSAPPPTAASSPAAPPASPPSSDCLFGNWREVSVATWTNLFGARVQLTGKGGVARFSRDGVHTIELQNISRTGTAGGDSYEVLFNGTLQLNYQADATTIYYSNPKSDGTTTWKVNGRVRETAQIAATLEPDTYKCQGNQLRLYSKDYAAEFERILPPGVPV